MTSKNIVIAETFEKLDQIFICLTNFFWTNCFIFVNVRNIFSAVNSLYTLDCALINSYIFKTISPILCNKQIFNFRCFFRIAETLPVGIQIYFVTNIFAIHNRCKKFNGSTFTCYNIKRIKAIFNSNSESFFCSHLINAFIIDFHPF